MKRRNLVASSVLATAFIIAPASAKAAVTKAQCIKANASAQSARRDGKFSEARAQLQACSDPDCPRMVRDDCAERLDELERAQPTVVFEAKDPAGHDLLDVAVTIDGHAVTDRLDGRAYPVDPGQHVFEFLRTGQPSAHESLVLNEGDKGRRVSVVVGVADPPAPVAVAPAPPSAPPPHTSGLGTQKIIGLAVGGAGVAGVAAGAVFGLLAMSAKDSYEQHCGSAVGAPPGACLGSGVSGHDDASAKATLSTAFFVGGGALAAAGVVLFVVAPNRHGSRTVDLGLGPAGLLMKGRF